MPQGSEPDYYRTEPVPRTRPRRRRKPNNTDDGTPSTKRARGRPHGIEPRSLKMNSLEDGSVCFPYQKEHVDNVSYDGFCWICYLGWMKKTITDPWCKKCKRVFHYSCLSKFHNWTERFQECPECLVKTVDGTNTVPHIPQYKLAVLLRILLEKLENMIGSHIPDLKKFICPRDLNNQHKYCMDLNTLQDIAHRTVPLVYRSPVEFFSDVNWIYFNCIVYGSSLIEDQSILEKQARMYRKYCEEELMDIEACPECYYNLASEDHKFVEPCPQLHTIVWAKMKGHPYWPAKVLKVIDGKANLRFFGRHEKYKLAVADCLMISRENPNPSVRDKTGFSEAQRELAQYVRNVIAKHGKFVYSPLHTPFEPGAADFRTKESKDTEISPGKRGRRGRTGRHSRTRRRTTGTAPKEQTENDVEVLCLSSDNESDNEPELITIESPVKSAPANTRFLDQSTSCEELCNPHANMNNLVLRDVPAANSVQSQSTAANTDASLVLDFVVDERDPDDTMRNVIQLNGLEQSGNRDGFQQVFALTDNQGSCSRVVSIPQLGVPEKYCQKLISNVLNIMQQMYSEMSPPVEHNGIMQKYSYQSRIAELEREKMEAFSKVSELVQNSSAVLSILKCKYSMLENKLLDRCKESEVRAQLLQEKLDESLKELEAVKEAEKANREELESKLKTMEEKWKQKLAEAREDADRRFQQYITSCDASNAEVEQLREERDYLEKLSREENDNPIPATNDELFAKIGEMIMAQTENIMAQFCKPIMDRLTAEEARYDGLRAKVSKAVEKLLESKIKSIGLLAHDDDTSMVHEAPYELKDKEWPSEPDEVVEKPATPEWEMPVPPLSLDTIAMDTDAAVQEDSDYDPLASTMDEDTECEPDSPDTPPSEPPSLVATDLSTNSIELDQDHSPPVLRYTRF